MASDTSISNPLLQPVQQDTANDYYTALLADLTANGIEIKPDAGGGRGKGVFATTSFQQGDVLWTERPLAAVQQLDSKLEVSTCSHCFKAVGTVEQHVGGKICCLINELSDATEEDDLRQVQDRVDKIQAVVNSQYLEGLLQGQVALPLTGKVDMAEPVKCRGGCGEEYCSPGCEAEAWERYHCLLCPVGAAAEPSSSSSSNDGKGKAKATTAHQHSASCSHAHAGDSSSSSSSGPGASSSSSKWAQKPAVQQVHGVAVNRAKLGAFFEHADETNDIFRVAAQVIASTIITADKLLQQAAADAAEGAEAGAAYAQALSAASAGKRIAARVVTPADAAAAAANGEGAGSSAAADREEQQEAAAAFARAAGLAQLGSETQQVLVAATSDAQQQQCLQALQAAFLPFAVGHKAPWWDVVAGQQEEAEQNKDSADGCDSDSEEIDTAELRAQLKELAADSLALLRAGLQDSRFPQLFDLQLYGSLVGMFELNNLALAVPAPVACYKDMLLHPLECGVDADAAAAALQEVQPLLDALGDDADAPAEGTGFYALQSCVNHSCAPNAAATCLPTGQMVVRALSDIPAGREVLLSYIEEEGTSLQERRAMLRDYGFVCGCERCSAEELAGMLEKQQLVAA